MELAFIPVVTLLLLLAGARIPATAGGGPTAAELLFRFGGNPREVAVAERAPFGTPAARKARYTLSPRGPEAVGTRAMLQATQHRLPRLRSRFGVLSAAYRAAAPPCA